jgi:hypothetical protein
MSQVWLLEIDTQAWAQILLFLSKNGWQPRCSVHQVLGSKLKIGGKVARHLAAAGCIVKEESLANPLTAYATLPFSLQTLAEIVEFASEGEFIICQ